MSEPFVSEIPMFAFGQAPDGWLPCDGRELSIDDPEYEVLYALIGTMYGGAEEAGIFQLPNLQDRMPMGGDQRTFPHGRMGGVSTHALTQDELPSHKHTLTASATPASDKGFQPGSNRLLSRSSTDLYGPAENLVRMNADADVRQGAGKPHTNEQPYLTLSFHIAVKGLFPSRG